MAREVAVGLSQEVVDIRLLIEAPHEEPLGAHRVFRPAQFLDEPCRKGGFARPAQSHEGNDARATGSPQRTQLVELHLSLPTN